MKINYNFKFKLLKFVYNGILTGMPLVVYNPISKNTLNVPLVVSPESTYLNLKLDDEQTNYLDSYIKDYTDTLDIVPISIFPGEKEAHYLSINVYNCSSSVFMNDEKSITRCEINTYVRNKDGNYGTIILDYLSNDLSMDPVNIFKQKEDIIFDKKDSVNIIRGRSIRDKISLDFKYNTLGTFKTAVSDSLIKYTDNIYYKTGIMDKIYYDSSLVNAIVKRPFSILNNDLDFNFVYKDLVFDKISNMFYFDNEIRFIGGMWDNLNMMGGDSF
tara:strand:+ start:160 stop:975 length:816 start_codon:yes stop_codon:yes gene_type:complete